MSGKVIGVSLMSGKPVIERMLEGFFQTYPVRRLIFKHASNEVKHARYLVFIDMPGSSILG